MAEGSMFTALVTIGRAYSHVTSPFAFLARRFVCAAADRVEGSAMYCLDIGAGTAPYRELVCRAFRVSQYITTDIAPTNRTQVVADACSLPLRYSSVDLVVSFDAIQHVSQPDSMMVEIANVLRPRGHVLLTFPFLYAECDFHDYQRWTMEGMEHLLARNGLVPVLAVRRGGRLFTAACALNWTMQHAIPGQRRSWRPERSLTGTLRSIALIVLTTPTIVLAWLALMMDKAFPSRGCYMGGAILACKAEKPEATSD